MITINLHSFKGKHFHDLYIFIMTHAEISYKLIIPREKNNSQQDIHFINSMQFGCAAYTARLLSEVSTDFSYTVPSPNKSQPFEYCIETTEPEKFVDVVYILLCVYNPNFATVPGEDFHFEAAQYYSKVYKEGRTDVTAYGLISVAREQLELWLRRRKAVSCEL